MANFIKLFTTIFILLVAETINAEVPIDQIQKIGTSLFRFLNPFELSREAIQVAGGMIHGSPSNVKMEEFYIPSELRSEKEAEGGRKSYGIEVLCNGKKNGYDCRGDDWDYESENLFKNGVTDLDYLTKDLKGVVPSNVQWAPKNPNLSTIEVTCTNPPCSQEICEGINCATQVKKTFAPVALKGIALGTELGIAAGFAIPAALIAKPIAWKVIIAAKVIFLKLVFLKKLFLVTAKIGAIKLIKGAFLAFPFLIVPILKGLGFFKLISAALVGGLKFLECMLRRFGPCENNLMREESLMLHVLPWFAQHREILNNDTFDIFKMPAEILENFANPSEIVGKDIMRSIPQIGLTPQSFTEIAHVLAENIGNVASLLKPNLRRLQTNNSEKEVPYEDAVQLHEIVQGVVNDLLGGFSAALYGFQEVRKEYNQFIEYSAQENPKLMERSLKDEILHRFDVSESVLKVIDFDPSMFSNDSITRHSTSAEIPSIEDIDGAFRSFAESIQAKTEMAQSKKE